MGCLADADALIAAAKGNVDSAKTAADNAMASVKGISPGSYSTREAYESAKASAIGSAQGAIGSYKSAVATMKAEASALNPFSAGSFEAMAQWQQAGIGQVMAIFKGMSGDGLGFAVEPDTIVAKATSAFNAEISMQCGTLPTPPDLPS